MGASSKLAAATGGPHYELYLDIVGRVRDEIEPFTAKAAVASDLKALRTARREGNLALVLGAGVSVPLRLLSWPDLNRALYESILPKKYATSVGPLIRQLGSGAPVLTRFVEGELPLRSELRRRVARELYRNFKAKTRTSSMTAIVDLLYPTTAKPPVSTVVTYNFDDLLERAITSRYPRLPFDIVFGEDTYYSSKRRLKIYHPHGYLPYEPGQNLEGDSAALVFSEREFHRQFVRFDCWQNIVQSYVYSSKVCLFVGISLSDPNLRRQLDIARRGTSATLPKHYAITKMNSDGTRLGKLTNYFREKDMISLGVAPLWVKSYRSVGRLLRLIATG